jgi:hypothetical protein
MREVSVGIARGRGNGTDKMGKEPTMKLEKQLRSSKYKKLPRWGRVAVVARAMRRTMPIITEMLEKDSRRILESIAFAVSQSEHSAAEGKVAEHLHWACNRLLALMKTEYDSYDECDDNYTMDALTAAYVVVQFCLDSDAELEMEAIDAISNVVFNFECYTHQKALTKAADMNANVDLDCLLSLSKKAELKFDSPVSVTLFGKLWPGSKPKGWPNVSGDTSACATFKRPRSNRKALSVLPEEVGQFLEQNPSYTIESPSLECGRIVLNKPAYLELSEHLFSMSMTDWADRDPNQNVSGKYVMTTIELVCYCEHYRPSGKLCWFVENECFGCIDSDFGTVYLFPGVSWKRLLARAGFYINSPWIEPKKPTVVLKNPWERLSFRKSRSAFNIKERRSDDEIVLELLNRKKLGTLKAETIRDDGFDTVCRRRPLDQTTVSAVEKILGYNLPPLLQRMYCEVANGGFGESYGLIGLVGGARDDTNRDVQQLLRDFRKPDKDDPKWKWSEGLLPAFYVGCAMYLCVDCRNSEGRVWLFEPNNHEDGRSWKNSFIPFSPSLRKMMDDWLDREDLWSIAGIRV